MTLKCTDELNALFSDIIERNTRQKERLTEYRQNREITAITYKRLIEKYDSDSLIIMRAMGVINDYIESGL